MKETQAVDLQDIGIEDVRCRKSVTGAMIIEVPGKENKEKADKLTTQLKEVFQNKKNVRVNRPEKMAELRVKNLDDSVKQEITTALALKGECSPDQVIVGEIKRVMPRSMGTAWAKCPPSAARKIVQLGRITVGWSSSRVDILPPRPLQCYKCLRTGHVRAQCNSKSKRQML